ncbi:acyl-CoA dehydrogenase family protein [Actinacidiphila sp. ITFR-21]|uniref:acyl-CoA dehydrogenase family protein n=1 Tax=Actinacidiphila sp. ITFR-21 TaxID=3075199 RepID=UPI00288B5E2E|nr:acyl-CoA dehydrogenase family protein [Streptomyces sp. ITFR-21]WNI18787.1 acyl-CoA dehydrogenase family protein [Streptomyces sp. ITFR-21]
MEFTLTEEQQQLRSEGLSLAELVPAPVAGRPVRDDEVVFAALAGKGVAGALLPAQDGGRGLGIADVCALWEGLGEGTTDASALLALSAHALLTAVPLWKLGTGQQRQRYLPRVADGQWVGALSLHELAGGSSPANRAVTARPAEDGGWLLDGAKSQVVNGRQAHHVLITAATGDGTASAFVLDHDLPGLRFEQTPDGLDRVVLDGASVPARALLGAPDAAYRELVPLALALDATAVLAPWLGIMRALSDRALAAALDGRLFGRPVGRFQNVRFAVADMRAQLELSTGVLYRAAWELDAVDRPGRQDAAVSRLFVTRAARSVVDAATEVLALAGRFPDPVAEQAARDVAWLEHAGGGVDQARSAVAASLAGLG